jgi:hypothetical protein
LPSGPIQEYFRTGEYSADIPYPLAMDVLDREALPTGEVLGRYKDQERTVERGFRFLKDPLFFTGSTFLKRPERVMALGMVMALALLVYALGEWALRRGLAETGSSLPDRKGRPTRRPTLRWVFGLFIWVRLVELEDRPLVLNLAPITRPRCAYWGWGDITSWSEGGAECGGQNPLGLLEDPVSQPKATF